MSELFLFDDAVARTFEPFALTRPISELRAGALLLRERWERAFQRRAAGSIAAPHLADFDEPGAARPLGTRLTVPAGSILANSRCAVSLLPQKLGDAKVWHCDGRVAAIALSREVSIDELRAGRFTLESLATAGSGPHDIAGQWIDHVWDFIGKLAPMLVEDLSRLSDGMKPVKVDGSGGKKSPVFAEPDAHIESQTYFDTSGGPVYVARGAKVQTFTRIVGPCYIGADSQVLGEKIAASSIGDVCKLHGEANSIVMLGHSNKGHEGFVGHSYFGRWVNLGAGTITSNLKNTYSSVELWTPNGTADTDLQFLGTMFGDHAKTGIGTPLNTGTVVGAGANVFGGTLPPKAVPPFAWGDRPPYDSYDIDKFFEVARRAMARRHVELSPGVERTLRRAYELRWSVDEPTETR
ncbi:MAG TPA: putative sugar nucleotidyl transferase [Gemmatimonadaceae bacterium]|nr:putative sugar nucleotidyl transferase [Gemmatimonadaceae bacterium]